MSAVCLGIFLRDLNFLFNGGRWQLMAHIVSDTRKLPQQTRDIMSLPRSTCSAKDFSCATQVVYKLLPRKILCHDA